MYDLLVSNMASLELLEFTQGFCPGKHIDLNSNMTFEPTYCKILNRKAISERRKPSLDPLSLTATGFSKVNIYETKALDYHFW